MRLFTVAPSLQLTAPKHSNPEHLSARIAAAKLKKATQQKASQEPKQLPDQKAASSESKPEKAAQERVDQAQEEENAASSSLKGSHGARSVAEDSSASLASTLSIGESGVDTPGSAVSLVTSSLGPFLCLLSVLIV